MRAIRSSDPFCGETEDEREILAQWIQHTLDTSPGTLVTAPTHGAGLRELLLQGLTEAAQVSIQAAVQAALEQGRMVSSARVELVRASLGGGKMGVSLKIEVKPMSGGDPLTYTQDLGEVAESMARGL